MPAAEIIALQGALDADSVPRLFRSVIASRGVSVLDLSAVSSVDSAGVAFVRELQTRIAALGGPRPTLRGVPTHFTQLCQAHRVGGPGD